MGKRNEFEGKTVQEATENALRELGVNIDEINIEVLDSPAKGFWGIGTKSAKIAVTMINEEDEEEYVEETDTYSQSMESNRPSEGYLHRKRDYEEEDDEDYNEEDDITDQVAVEFLKEIFDKMSLVVQFDVEVFKREVFINITGDDVGIIIGKRGETLEAIQYLTSLAVGKKAGRYKRVIIDIENYRKRREDSLVLLAERIAAKAVRTGEDVTLEPMNSFERRIIHSTLQEHNKVQTYSIGEGLDRRVVVSLK